MGLPRMHQGFLLVTPGAKGLILLILVTQLLRPHAGRRDTRDS